MTSNGLPADPTRPRPKGGHTPGEASYGDLAAVSFNGNKIMTTSGGGALLTDSADVATRTRYLATQARQPAVHYEHIEVGYNYRMSNLLAALGRAQLARLDAMIAQRRENRRRYSALFAEVSGVRIFGQPDGVDGGDSVDNFWLTSVVVDPTEAGWKRDDLIAALAAENIEARPLWKPMHLQPVFKNAPRYTFREPISEALYSNGVSLPSSSAMDAIAWNRVADAIRSFMRNR